MVEQGRTPVLPRDELAALGFQLVLYPVSGLYAAARALEAVYERLRAEGTTAGAEKELIAFERFNDLLGVEEKHALATRYDGDSQLRNRRPRFRLRSDSA